MKTFHLIWLTCAVVCFSGCLARRGLKTTRGNDNKEVSVKARPTESPVTSDENSATYERPLPTTALRVSGRQEVNVATDAPTSRRKSRLRLSQMNHSERKCCKQGQRAARKGYFCNVDLFYAKRFTNMEHNRKMKFHIKPVSKKAQRFVDHIERWCVKTRLKSVFYKCCVTA